MIPILPLELIEQGLNWRWATQDDLKFIVFSWLSSLEAAWLNDEATTDLPISSKLTDTVNDALDDTCSPDPKVSQKAIRLLNRIFQAELSVYIKNALLQTKPLVLYSEDSPDFLVGWALKNEYCYIKETFRHTGFASLLLKTLNSSKNEIDYKCRTSKGIKLLKKV